LFWKPRVIIRTRLLLHQFAEITKLYPTIIYDTNTIIIVIIITSYSRSGYHPHYYNWILIVSPNKKSVSKQHSADSVQSRLTECVAFFSLASNYLSYLIKSQTQ